MYIVYLKKIEENGSLLSQHAMGIPSIAGFGSMRYCMGLGGVIPLVGSKGKTQKAPNILRYLKIANSGLFYSRRVTQNKQTGTSKNTMKYSQSEEKFCYLKHKLLIQIKIAKQFFYK